jgi:hypothetical protein
VLISPDYFGQLMLAKICIWVENMPTFKPPLQIQSSQGKDEDKTMLNIIVEASVYEKLTQNLHTLDAQKPGCLTDVLRPRRSIFVKKPGFCSLEYQHD